MTQLVESVLFGVVITVVCASVDLSGFSVIALVLKRGQEATNTEIVNDHTLTVLK